MSSRFSTSGCGCTQKDKIKHLKIDKFTHYQTLLHKITTSKHSLENHKLRSCNLMEYNDKHNIAQIKDKITGYFGDPYRCSHEMVRP